MTSLFKFSMLSSAILKFLGGCVSTSVCDGEGWSACLSNSLTLNFGQGHKEQSNVYLITLFKKTSFVLRTALATEEHRPSEKANTPLKTLFLEMGFNIPWVLCSWKSGDSSWMSQLVPGEHYLPTHCSFEQCNPLTPF